MSYQRDRDQFIATMATKGIRVDIARSILRCAAMVQRLAVEACNRELSEIEERRAQRAEERIVSLLRLAGSEHGNALVIAVPEFQGDPRGYCVKLHFHKCKVQSCSDAVGVPTRRY